MEEQGRLSEAILSHADDDQISRGLFAEYQRMQRDEPASAAEEVVRYKPWEVSCVVESRMS